MKRSLCALLALPLLSGCASVEYYWQGIRGELDLLERAEPIPTVIDATSDAMLKRKLATRYADDRIAYTEAKAPFIRAVVADAESWAKQSGWQP